MKEPVTTQTLQWEEKRGMDTADLVRQSQALKIPAYLQSTADLRNTAVAQNIKASETNEQPQTLLQHCNNWASSVPTVPALQIGKAALISHANLMTPYCTKIPTYSVE